MYDTDIYSDFQENEYKKIKKLKVNKSCIEYCMFYKLTGKELKITSNIDDYLEYLKEKEGKKKKKY
jgi:hypothetical protein